MTEQIRYITDEHGDRVGVLLDLALYQRLRQDSAPDPELLEDLTQAELTALAQGLLAPAAQQQLGDLLARNTDNQLSPEELTELDQLLEQIDQLTLLKTRARYTLHQRETV